MNAENVAGVAMMIPLTLLGGPLRDGVLILGNFGGFTPVEIGDTFLLG
jgi:hypothetical protein